MIQTNHSSGDPLADRRAGFAADLAEAGDAKAAADLMRQALERAPLWPEGLVTLGLYLERDGRPGEAAEAYRAARALDAEDGQGAGLRLAALGLSPPPAAAPPAFVRGLFDQYAERFEASLVGTLGYGVPREIMEALHTVAGEDARFAAVLDLGCGTGLMGERLRPIAGTLVGVDLSPGMLGKARRKGIYDRLAEADIAGFDAGGAAFDLVVAADVLIYIGALAAVFGAARDRLLPGGLFAFSLEVHEGPEPSILLPSLRFAHSVPAAEALAAEFGFAVRCSRRAAIRQDRGAPIAGVVMVLERM